MIGCINHSHTFCPRIVFSHRDPTDADADSDFQWWFNTQNKMMWINKMNGWEVYE